MVGRERQASSIDSNWVWIILGYYTTIRVTAER